VLQHGFTESLADWYEAGYVQALRPDYRLILIDARGHGVDSTGQQSVRGRHGANVWAGDRGAQKSISRSQPALSASLLSAST